MSKSQPSKKQTLKKIHRLVKDAIEQCNRIGEKDARRYLIEAEMTLREKRYG